MIKIKNQRGITIIALVLTIVVMLILVSITVKTGIESIEHSRMVSFVSKMQLLQKKVDFLAENGGYESLGEGVNENKANQLKTIVANENLDTPIRILPSEYQQVEYIESTGTQYINTNILGNSGIGIECDVAWTDITDNSNVIFGTRADNGDTRFLSMLSEGINMSYGKTIKSGVIPVAGKIYHLIFDTTSNTFRASIDNEWSTEQQNINILTNIPIYLFTLNRYGSTVSHLYAKARLMNFKIRSSNRALIRDFIPCYRKSDEKPGLFDLATGDFYINQGTGEFEIGPIVDNAVRYFNNQAIANDLGIENIDDEIVVDFETRQIVSLNGIEYEGKMYYTQYNLPGGQTVKQNTTETNRQIDNLTITTAVNGLNANFTISGINQTNGTLSYSRDNKETWQEITNYTVTGEDVVTENITKSGTYYFKWTDNTNKNNEQLLDVITIKLANPPALKGNLGELREEYNYSSLDSTKWAYATDSETEYIYVWIPRFAFENADTTNIEFLRGTSLVTTSENYLPETGWTIPNVFKDVTGIWVKVSSTTADNSSILDNIITGEAFGDTY